jgi:hypothetical protein
VLNAAAGRGDAEDLLLIGQLCSGRKPARSGRLLNHFATKRTCIAASRARPPQDNGRRDEDGRIGSYDDADKKGEREVV